MSLRESCKSVKYFLRRHSVEEKHESAKADLVLLNLYCILKHMLIGLTHMSCKNETYTLCHGVM